MDHFSYQNQTLCAENIAISDIVKQVGTPCYIYSRATLEHHWRVFDNALKTHPHRICYAVKANSNLAILNLFARLGSGFDIVSAGELARVLAAGGDVNKIIFSGVGKTRDEIIFALRQKIYCFNVESAAELERIQQLASELNLRAPVALRINPNVDAKTHPHIATGLKENKFGIPYEEAFALYQRASQMNHIEIVGVACHIGSQLTQVEPFLLALTQLENLVDRLTAAHINIRHIDIGGGLGVRYHEEAPPHPNDYATALLKQLKHRSLEIILEPGRVIAANAGILVTTVEYLKHTQSKNFAIVDCGMNDLLRPALYQAWHEIIAVTPNTELPSSVYDIVGPICETADVLGKNRVLSIQAGDLLAVRGAGAYGFSMASHYNSRPRAAEVLVDGDQFYVVRKRETIAELFAQECILDHAT